MKTIHFPYVALPLGVVFFLTVIAGREQGMDGATTLPLLTLLVVSEFAFFATGIGAYIGLKHTQAVGIKPLYVLASVLCALLSVRFMFLGIDLWPS